LSHQSGVIGSQRNNIIVTPIFSISDPKAIQLHTITLVSFTTMTIKVFAPAVVIGSLFILSACNPEKLPASDEVYESKEESLAEQKLDEGKKIYESNCAGCHDAGVSGAPKPGDKEAWRDRISLGLAVMAKKSIEGFEGKTGMMPPKGGNSTLTDSEITNAVNFMTLKAR
jgi:cytochrome c5